MNALAGSGTAKGVESGSAVAAMRRPQHRAGSGRRQLQREMVEELFAGAKTMSVLRRRRQVGLWEITQQLEVADAAFDWLRRQRSHPARSTIPRTDQTGLADTSRVVDTKSNLFLGRRTSAAAQSVQRSQFVVTRWQT